MEASSKVELDLRIIGAGARGLIQELDCLRIKPPPEVQDAESLGQFGVIRIGLARLRRYLERFGFISRPGSVKEGEIAQCRCKGRIRVDSLSIGVDCL